MNISALEQLTGKIPTYPVQEGQPETKIIQQFAADNGLSYSSEEPTLVEYNWRDYKRTPAWLGLAGMGMTKSAYHVVSGTYRDYSLRMFLKQDTFPASMMAAHDAKFTPEELEQYTRKQTTGIVRVQLSKVFPQVVLDSNKNDRTESSVGTSYDNTQRLSLEGDFDAYFDLYSPRGLQVNVLTLLAPNMMQILKDHAGLFDVEFYGNEMILMTKSSLYDPKVMQAMCAALDEQLAYLQRLLPSWNYTPNQQPFDVLVKPFVTGSVLKIGSLRISPANQIIGAFGLFGVISLIMIILSMVFD